MRYIAAIIALLMSITATEAQQGQGSPKSYLSAGTTNCTLVQGGSVTMLSGLYINTTAALYYLKIYDTATTPVPGMTPVRRIPVPFGAASAGGGVMDIPPGGLNLRNGLGFCLTGAIADNDVTVAATGVTINFSIR